MWGGRPIKRDLTDFWQSRELNAMVRELQPAILINNRSGEAADFGTPEQRVTAEGEGRPWETCMTLNFAPGWGFVRHSLANKNAGEALFHLLDAVRLGGNFLFNVGPRSDGRIDDREGRVLEQLGRWLRQYGDAVYGTRPVRVYPASGHAQGPMYHYGMWTCKGTTAYFTMFYYPGEELVVSKIGPGIRAARLLPDGRELSLTPLANRRTLIRGLPATPPDPLAPVIEVEFEAPPYALTDLDADWLAGKW
jgi:alpha-L-fucosidase